tara:strand:+ start:3992 stop:4210 length:219 start_codon:yes stop_codon:yes gene_type:complete
VSKLKQDIDAGKRIWDYEHSELGQKLIKRLGYSLDAKEIDYAPSSKIVKNNKPSSNIFDAIKNADLELDIFD